MIDDSLCTLEEYRVYSQLTRYGYRIQRYFYEESDKCNRSDEFTLVKRKIIVDPENGLRMSDNQPQNKQSVKKSKLTLTNNMPETSDKSINIENHEKTMIQEFVKQVISDLVDQVVCNIVKRHENEPTTFREVENNVIEKVANSEEKNRHSKPEIISDETLLGNIKILRDTSCKVSWPGTRIQRNVKQLPKRNDKILFPEISIIDSDTSENSRYPEKRKAVLQIDELHVKKSKHEVRYSQICILMYSIMYSMYKEFVNNNFFSF